MKKIQLNRDTYGGLPYPAGSILEVADDEGTFAINSGAAIYADADAPISPPPSADVMAQAAKLAEEREKARRDALTPEELRKEDEARKDKEEARKAQEKKDKEHADLYNKMAKEDAKVIKAPYPSHLDEDKTTEDPDKTKAQGGTDYGSKPGAHATPKK